MLSLLMAAIGVALIVQGVTAHGGVSSSRLLLGALFVAGGVARIWVEQKRSHRA